MGRCIKTYSGVNFLFIFLWTVLSLTGACTPKDITLPKTEAALPQTVSVDAQKRFVWGPNKDCALCHVLEARSITRNRLLAYQHGEAGETCETCHDASNLDLKHKNVTEEKAARVPAKKYPPAFCFNCHGSYEELAELTKDSTVCTDERGNVANPHDTHLGQTDCYHCHRIHRISSNVRYCYTCHHAGVFECGTCHVIPSNH